MTKPVQCEHCKKQMSSISRICPHCGNERTHQIENVVLHCPRCHCTLQNFNYRSTRLNKCAQCNGLWVNVKDFHLLTSECDVYRDDTVSPDFVAFEIGNDDRVSVIACDKSSSSDA